MNNPFERIQNSAEFQEELFVSEIQSYLASLLEREGMNRADLARLLGVSRARVTQIFSDDCPNLTVRTLARLFFALGEEVTVCSRGVVENLAKPEGTFSSDIDNAFDAWVRGIGQIVELDSSVRVLLKEILEKRRDAGPGDKIARGGISSKSGTKEWAHYNGNVVSLDERRKAYG